MLNLDSLESCLFPKKSDVEKKEKGKKKRGKEKLNSFVSFHTHTRHDTTGYVTPMKMW